MAKVIRETAAALEYGSNPGVPWPWNVPDGEWTYELYESVPEDGNRYEVIEGRLTMAPSPGFGHQRSGFQLGLQLGIWAKENGAGEVLPAPFAVVLPHPPRRQRFVEPDWIFVAKDRSELITQKNIQGAPDLLVEILSPGTARADWVEKKTAYEKSGVAHYWVVDPDQQVLTAFRLKDGKYELEARVGPDAIFEPEGFPGLRINLAEVWG